MTSVSSSQGLLKRLHLSLYKTTEKQGHPLRVSVSFPLAQEPSVKTPTEDKYASVIQPVVHPLLLPTRHTFEDRPVPGILGVTQHYHRKFVIAGNVSNGGLLPVNVCQEVRIPRPMQGGWVQASSVRVTAVPAVGLVWLLTSFFFEGLLKRL